MKNKLLARLIIFIFVGQIIALIIYFINSNKLFIPMLFGGVGAFLATSYKEFKK